MPLNAGAPSYGSVDAATCQGLTGSGASESFPLIPPDSVPWKPLTREELGLAAGGAFWSKVRSRLVIAFWLCWIGILCIAIAIIVESPRPTAQPLQWWQKSLFYQLQPALFTDTSVESPGGITAVHDNLPYLSSLGVGALILEGLFKKAVSPPDLTVIDESVGTVPQFQQLLAETNKIGIKVLLDFCELDLLGTRDQAGNDTNVPSELMATVQYAIRYWLEQGVAGFAICDTDAAYSEQTLLEWRVVIKEFSTEEEERIVVVKQTGGSLPTIYSSVNDTLVEVVMRSILPSSHHLLSAQEVAYAVETLLQSAKQDVWQSWRVGGEAAAGLRKLLLVLMMTLPGSPVVQYGEEVNSLQNVSVSWKGGVDSPLGATKPTRASLALFSSLSRSRAKEEALLYGSFTYLPFNTTSLVFSNSTSTTSSTSPPLLAFLRSWGCVHFLILLNTGSVPHALDPAWAPNLPDAGVFVTSTEMNRMGATSLDTLILEAQEAIVIKLFEA